jgi:hypothetical protein
VPNKSASIFVEPVKLTEVAVLQEVGEGI